MWRLLLFTSTVVNVYGFSGRIIGGSDTTIDKYPYQVSVQHRGSHTCGGSIINEKFVLTAAHCVYEKSFKDISVRLKSSYSEKEGLLVSGIKIIVWHNQYDEYSQDYDVALIKLPTPLKGVKPIKLADASTVVPDQSNAVVTGWGRLAAGGPMSSKLQVVTVPTINWNKCKQKYAGLNLQLTDRMICAGTLTGDKNVCQGDSGGPLVFKGVQIGIVSWGDGCAKRGYYGVYTRVSAVHDWIQKTIKQY